MTVCRVPGAGNGTSQSRHQPVGMGRRQVTGGNGSFGAMTYQEVCKIAIGVLDLVCARQGVDTAKAQAGGEIEHVDSGIGGVWLCCQAERPHWWGRRGIAEGLNERHGRRSPYPSMKDYVIM